MSERDTYRYRYPDGYAGITGNPSRRAGEHRRAGRRGTMMVVGPRVTRKSALAAFAKRQTDPRSATQEVVKIKWWKVNDGGVRISTSRLSASDLGMY